MSSYSVGMTPAIRMAGNKLDNGENASVFLGYLDTTSTELIFWAHQQS